MGCLVLPLPGFRHIRLGHYVRGPCLPALLAALGTSGYTMIDDEALRQLRGVQNAGLSNVELTLLYAALQTISTSLALAGYVILNGSERRRLAETWRTALGGATLTGLIITVTYGLVLVSMAHVANVSYVAAFRQLSIPLGAILGIVVQKEPCPVPKWVGIIIISVGMVLVGVG